MVKIIPVSSPRQLRDFIHLPSRLYSSYPNFVPPFYRLEFEFHDPGKNKQLKNSETIKLLAYNGNEPAGRVMGIIYHPWNDSKNVKQARFYQLDCINNQEICNALLTRVELWARENGMTEVIGSFGFSDKDPQGMQVEGFELAPVIASTSHAPYLPGLVAASGYDKYKDCVSYRVEIPTVFPKVYSKVHERITRNKDLRLVEFKNRKSLRSYFVPVMKLMNSTYRDIFGFVALNEEDINHLAEQYLSVLEPELVKIVVNENNQPVAFVIAMANISEGLKKSGGKLFPFGFIRIWYEMRTSTQLDLLLGAVDERYRGRGLGVLMGIPLMETARKKGMKVMDSHLILEENHLMRMEMEKLGGKIMKRYRIFSKKLITL